MKEIALTQGKVTWVDTHDYLKLIQWKWCALKRQHTWYAVRGIPRPKRGLIYMHRQILGLLDQREVDHANHSGLDNRRSNLRFVTHQENAQNQRPRQNTTSNFRGVYRPKVGRKWVAQITVNQRTRKLGSYSTAVEAALAYDRAAREALGIFAHLNFP